MRSPRQPPLSWHQILMLRHICCPWSLRSSIRVYFSGRAPLVRERCPGKPHYDMAPDGPLLLHGCSFRSLDFQHTPEVHTYLRMSSCPGSELSLQRRRTILYHSPQSERSRHLTCWCAVEPLSQRPTADEVLTHGRGMVFPPLARYDRTT